MTTRPIRTLLDSSTLSPPSSPPKSTMTDTSLRRRSSRFVDSPRVDYSPFKMGSVRNRNVSGGRTSRNRERENSPVRRERENSPVRRENSPVRRVKSKSRSRSRSRSRMLGLTPGIGGLHRAVPPGLLRLGEVAGETPVKGLGVTKNSFQSNLSDSLHSFMENTKSQRLKCWLEQMNSPRTRLIMSSLALLFLFFTLYFLWVNLGPLMTDSLEHTRLVIMTLPEIIFSALPTMSSRPSIRLEVGETLSDIKNSFEKITDEKIKEIQMNLELKFHEDLNRLTREMENKVNKHLKLSSVKDTTFKDDLKLKIDTLEEKVSGVEKNLLEQSQISNRETQFQSKQDMKDTKMTEEGLDLEAIKKDVSILVTMDLNGRLDSLQQEMVKMKESMAIIDELDKDIQEVKQNVEKKVYKEFELVRNAEEKTINIVNSVLDLGKKLLQLQEVYDRLPEAMSRSEFALEKEELLVTVKEEMGDLKVSLNSDVELSVKTLVDEMWTVSQSSSPGSQVDTLVDWASEAAGGLVVKSSPTYQESDLPSPPGLSVLGVVLWHHLPSPSDLLRPSPPGPALCSWASRGQSASLTLQLASMVRLTNMGLQFPLTMSDTSSAPRSVLLWDEDSTNAGPLLNLTYEVETGGLQSFLLPNPALVKRVRLEVLSNWGHERYTCLQGIRLIGIKEGVIM